MPTPEQPAASVLDRMADNARELGLDYETAPTGAQELPPLPSRQKVWQLLALWERCSPAAAPDLAKDVDAHLDEMLRTYAAQAIAAQAGQEPRAWANGDELDNMLDDRTATVTGVPSGWRKTPLYAHPAAPAPAAAAPEWRTIADALRPFADIGAWLHARPLPDDTPMVDLHGLNGQAGALTRGHFKAAHRALQALEFATPTPRPAEAGPSEADLDALWDATYAAATAEDLHGPLQRRFAREVLSRYGTAGAEARDAEIAELRGRLATTMSLADYQVSEITELRKCAARAGADARALSMCVQALRSIVPVLNATRMIMVDPEARDFADELVSQGQAALDAALAPSRPDAEAGTGERFWTKEPT